MNSPERWQQIEKLFHAALEQEPHKRAAFLATASQDDTVIAEVNNLLAAHSAADSFLRHSPVQGDDATQILTTPPERIPQNISHFQIVSLLGKGGMGEVYLATDTNLGRQAALKILPVRFTTNAELVHRFEREAKAASALNHPNILTVYEIGQTENTHYIATEYIAGETLRARLLRNPLPLAEAIDIALQIAAALTAAHDARIIHRDIKPDNIMLRPDGYVKVLDFGLAKLTENSLSPLESTTTQTGMILGTPSYMSPEQARGQHVDLRSDIWSLGVVLYEMVSGARPFSGNTQADLLVAILEREPTPLPANLPTELCNVISTALAKDPNNRYQTMQQCTQELKAVQRQLLLSPDQNQIETNTAIQYPNTPTIQIPARQTTEQFGEQTKAAQPLFAPIPAAITSKQRIAGIALVGVLLLAGLSTGWWYWQSQKNVTMPTENVKPVAPTHTLTCWFDVRRMAGGKLDGKLFESAGMDILTNGSKFKFNLISPQNGYLYLINEGEEKNNVISLNLLYPTPKNNNRNAAVTAQQPIQTDNYVLDQNDGVEKFWIVWATNKIPEIEVAKADANPTIKNATQSAAILALLKQHAANSSATPDEKKERLTVTATSEILVSLVRLQHR